MGADVEEQTLTFLGGKRVIVLKDTYFLITEKVKSKLEHDLEKRSGMFHSDLFELNMFIN